MGEKNMDLGFIFNLRSPLDQTRWRVIICPSVCSKKLVCKRTFLVMPIIFSTKENDIDVGFAPVVETFKQKGIYF